jgi:SAM-dependent methyltransferase
MPKRDSHDPESLSHLDRAHWDARYRDSFKPRPPAELLQTWIDRLPAGRALDLACGAGRNALLLAERGWRTLGVDLSPVGLHLARDEARRRGLQLDLLAVDLQAWRWPRERFDLVGVFRFLDRALCLQMAAALRPGGALIYETFTIDQRSYEGGPRSDAMLLQPGELPTLFPTLEALEYEEGVFMEAGRPRALARLVGRRPA